jgi:hydroxyethylthiazole kinase-like uncharacterized protein yjeF
MRGRTDWIDLDARLLRGWPLPEVAEDADKEDRGRVLVIGGSREIGGAVVLAATAALRAGAGKLAIATGQSVAAPLALLIPEARVIALPETAEGGFALEGLALIEESARAAAAVLVGPGLMDEKATTEFVAGMLPMVTQTPLVLDALAMNALTSHGRLSQPVLLTPHAGEMAHLSGRSKEAIVSDPAQAAQDAAREWNAVVALKGAITFIATTGGQGWRHHGGNPGLATSGSGDVLAGIIAGLAAQQAPLEQACGWGVVLHALAGDRLAQRLGPLGYLARELPGELPAVMKKLRRTAGFKPAARSKEPRE